MYLAMAVIFTRLIVKVIKHVRSMNERICKDFRFFILFVCWYSSMFVFLQMGVIKFELRALTNFGVGMNSSIIINVLGLYYINKSSKILPNGKRHYHCVAIWTMISTSIYISVGIKGFAHYEGQKTNLCTLQEYY
jgi:hypothetical protein